ncbi:MAG: glycosyltransferase family 4 protein [Methylophilaceae bacterium]
MKILILSQYFWPEGFLINEMASALKARGHEIEVITGKPNYPDGKFFTGYGGWGLQKETWRDITIHRLPMLARGSKSGIRLALNYCSFMISGLVFAPWLLRKAKVDVIFVYAPSPILQAIPAIFLGWLKKSPVVLWVQDLWPESLLATGYIKNKYILKPIEQIVRFIYRHVNLLLVQSEAFIEPVSARASDTPVKYYPNSVDESFYLPAKMPAPEVAGLTQHFSVLFAGNIGSAQAVEVIVAAAILLREKTDIQWVVLGDGSRRNWMLQEVKKHGLTNLHLPGRYPVETMPAFMQTASVLLVTLADQPIFNLTVPSKLQACLAAGRPIVACLNGEGAKLVTAAGAGLAVPAEDGRALADAILQLYYMPPAGRESMGEQGRLYYQQHFSHNVLIDDLIGHLQSGCNEY